MRRSTAARTGPAPSRPRWTPGATPAGSRPATVRSTRTSPGARSPASGPCNPFARRSCRSPARRCSPSPGAVHAHRGRCRGQDLLNGSFADGVDRCRRHVVAFTMSRRPEDGTTSVSGLLTCHRPRTLVVRRSKGLWAYASANLAEPLRAELPARGRARAGTGGRGDDARGPGPRGRRRPAPRAALSHQAGRIGGARAAVSCRRPVRPGVGAHGVAAGQPALADRRQHRPAARRAPERFAGLEARTPGTRSGACRIAPRRWIGWQPAGPREQSCVLA